MRVWQRPDGKWSAEVWLRDRQERAKRTHALREVVEGWAILVEAAKLRPIEMRLNAMREAVAALPPRGVPADWRSPFDAGRPV